MDYMEDIQALVTKFRQAVDRAKDNGEFHNDFSFNHFPRACCGDASVLLGEYLLEHGISSTYVCGKLYFDDPEAFFQSHAWLVAAGGIADITGDQFSNQSVYLNYDIPAYYSPPDDFHRLFEVEDSDVHPFSGLKNYNAFCLSRLYEIYAKILKYL